MRKTKCLMSVAVKTLKCENIASKNAHDATKSLKNSVQKYVHCCYVLLSSMSRISVQPNFRTAFVAFHNQIMSQVKYTAQFTVIIFIRHEKKYLTAETLACKSAVTRKMATRNMFIHTSEITKEAASHDTRPPPFLVPALVSAIKCLYDSLCPRGRPEVWPRLTSYTSRLVSRLTQYFSPVLHYCGKKTFTIKNRTSSRCCALKPPHGESEKPKVFSHYQHFNDPASQRLPIRLLRVKAQSLPHILLHSFHWNKENLCWTEILHILSLLTIINNTGSDSDRILAGFDGSNLFL